MQKCPLLVEVYWLGCDWDMMSEIELLFWTEGENFFIRFVMSTECVMFHFVWTSLNTGMNWTWTYVQKLYHFVSKIFDKAGVIGRNLWLRELKLRSGNTLHTSQFWGPKSQGILWIWKKFGFFTRNLILVFKISAWMRSLYFDCHLVLISKVFWQSFRWFE